MANRWGKVERVTGFIFFGSKITADGDCSHEIKTLAPWKESYDKPRQLIKKQRQHFADKGLRGCCCEPRATPGFVTSGEEDFDLEPETRLDDQSFLCSRIIKE